MRISDWSSDVCSSDLDLARQQPVDAAQNGVLFVDNGRNAVLMRSEQRWQRGIAAEAYHHGWLKGFMETARHVSPGLDALQAPEPTHGTTRHSSGRPDMDLRLVKQAGDFSAPRSEERRVGTECVRTCRSRRAPA